MPKARAFTSGPRDPARVKSAASTPDPSIRLKSGSGQDDFIEESVPGLHRPATEKERVFRPHYNVCMYASKSPICC